MTFLIRRPGDEWRQPSTTSYDDEAALQALLAASPDLLPVDEPIALVREFWIPGVGSVDLVGVSQSGLVVIVECKLIANPQIRREVVGQALAYAGGVWRMEHDEFFAEFEAKSSLPFDDVVQALGVDDPATVRRALSDSLDRGDFRVVIAVDEITAELRMIVEYLNAHTRGLEIVALELSYSREDDIEILVPEVYGVEAAEVKRSASASSKPRWGVTDVQAAFSDGELSQFADLVDQLLTHGKQYGARFGGGTGKNPAVSCYYLIEGSPTSCWALYVGDAHPRLALSFGSIANQSPSHAQTFLEHLQHVDGFESLNDLDPDGLSKYPTLPLDEIDSAALEHLLHGVDLIRDSSPSHSI